MTRMFEIEHIKCMALFGSAVFAKISGDMLAVVATDDEWSKWIERSGTGLSIFLLLMGLRYMRDKVEAREKRIDDLMERDREIHEKATESRVHLAQTLAELKDAINRK